MPALGGSRAREPPQGHAVGLACPLGHDPEETTLTYWVLLLFSGNVGQPAGAATQQAERGAKRYVTKSVAF